jgi:hypothetical protein
MKKTGKRKRVPKSEGSRFIECPACGKQIALLLLNAHLDACAAPAAEQRSSQPAAAALQPAGKSLAPSASAKTTLPPARAPLAFARQNGRRMPLTDEQLPAHTPCEVGNKGRHVLVGSYVAPSAAWLGMLD